MRRIIATAVAILIATTVQAGGPWTDKSYNDWDAKDLRTILYSSPWVRHFGLTKLPIPEGSLPGEGPSGMGYQGYHSKHAQPDDTQTMQFIVRWVSSRTLREAWARGLVLRKQIPESEIDKHLPPSPHDFEIAVEGRDMSPFQEAREATLKAKSYLLVESSRIAPTLVKLVRSPDGRIKSLVFHFPRRSPTGEPLISTHARSVKFVEHGGRADLTVTFYPQTMVDKEGRDL